MDKALQQKIDLKTKPVGSLGKLETLAKQIGIIQGSLTPVLCKPTILVFAGDHGITQEGVSPFPQEVTYQMVMNFVGGGAAINVFCKANDINLKVVDAGVNYEFPADLGIVHAKIAKGTHNFLKEPAMSFNLCERAMKKGGNIVNTENTAGCNVIGFGEMGIGNTSSATLLMHKLTGISIADCTGRGTGHDDAGLTKKEHVLLEASKKHAVSEAFEVLVTYGGFEIAMMVGAMLEAAQLGMIILVDGFIATAAMLVASKMKQEVLSNAVFCHTSEEKGHRMMLKHLGADPILDLGMRLGEGSGAAVAYPIVKSAVAFLNEMASFEDAGVSNKE